MSQLHTRPRFYKACFEALSKGIDSIETEVINDIYAISFYYYEEEDDPHQPVLEVGYNTNAQWHSKEAEASDSMEAKWNYAFWLQNTVMPPIGLDESELTRLRDEWVESLATWDDSLREFVSIVVMAARRLQQSGVVEAKFHRRIPIIVHRLEYHADIAFQSCAANPGGLADEFADWVFEFYDQWGL